LWQIGHRDSLFEDDGQVWRMRAWRPGNKLGALTSMFHGRIEAPSRVSTLGRKYRHWGASIDIGGAHVGGTRSRGLSRRGLAAPRLQLDAGDQLPVVAFVQK
jgi:hypothetical protein